jgi:hypothetical protein
MAINEHFPSARRDRNEIFVDYPKAPSVRHMDNKWAKRSRMEQLPNLIGFHRRDNSSSPTKVKHFGKFGVIKVWVRRERLFASFIIVQKRNRQRKTMNQSLIILLASCLLAGAQTEERINKRFAVQPGGKIVVDVDFGSIEVNTNGTSEVAVDVFRKVTRKSKADEEEFLRDHAVTFAQEGNTVTIRSRAKTKSIGWWRGLQRTEGKYTLSVPSQFDSQLKSSGGGIAVSDLTGTVNAATSGGGLKFTRLHGSLDGDTSGGGIRLADCEGPLKVHTSGGGIELSGGSGTFAGGTSGGSVVVKGFRGAAQVGTSGGGITLEDVAGKVDGSTSGGSISAQFSAPLSEPVKLETSGGGVTVRVAQGSAFELDAATSGGGVSCDLPVTIVGKVQHSRLQGAVNGGGKPMVLRTSGGSIHVKKL